MGTVCYNELKLNITNLDLKQCKIKIRILDFYALSF